VINFILNHIFYRAQLNTAYTQNINHGINAALTGTRVAKVSWLIDETLKSLTNIVAIISSLTGLNSKFAEPWQVFEKLFFKISIDRY
jgi:hypothetical protein